jgi:hypothetical protein
MFVPIVRMLRFVSLQDMTLFSSQKRPGKLWGTSVLSKGVKLTCRPSIAELRVRAPVLTFPSCLQDVHRKI